MHTKLRYIYGASFLKNEQFFKIVCFIFFLFCLSNGYAQNPTDDFSSNNFSGGSGWATASWTTNNSPTVVAQEVFSDGGINRSFTRTVDLSTFPAATWTMDWRCQDSSSGFESDDQTFFQVSYGGGAFTTLQTLTEPCPNSNDSDSGSISLPLKGGDANTQIRILTSNNSASEDMYFDNVLVTLLTASDLVATLSPFTCEGKLYQVYASPAQIGLIDIRNSSFNDLPNSPASTPLNASGYRISNNIAYAINNGTVNLWAIGSDGSDVKLGAISGLPTGTNFTSGDFGPDGYLYVKSSDPLYRRNIYKIDVDAVAVVSTLAIGVDADFLADFAYNPATGLFYGVQNSNGDFVSINPSTGATNIIGNAGTTSESWGAMFADISGRVAGIRNVNGSLYEFNITTGVPTILGSAAITSSNDGFSCSNALFNFDTDFSDAPLTYGSTSHTIRASYYIGATVPDDDASAQPTATADGDDTDTGGANFDDDDTVLTALITGQSTTWDVSVVGTNGFLQVWVDFNTDGNFGDAGEQVAVNLQDDGTLGDATANDGVINVTFTVPASANTISPSFTRLRWSSLTGLNTTQIAPDGEVEDYQVSIIDRCDALASGNLDTDEDNISDVCDLDDDNDGILDTDELNCSGFIDLDQTFSDNSSNPGTINDVYPFGGVTVDFKYELLGSANWSGGVSSQTAVGVTGSYINTQPISTDFPNGDVAVYTFSFSESVYNLSFKLGGFDNQDRADLIATNSGANVPINITDINLNDGVVSGQSAYDVNGGGANAPSNSVQVSINGPTNELIITVGKTDGENNHATIQIYELSYCAEIDTDNDGTPNHLDTDSDDDGCPDALEGDATNTQIGYSDLDGSSQITGGVDGDGVPNPASGGQGIGTSIDDTMQADECSTCDINNPRYVDTDSDLIADDCDLDDDNDGILDTDEHPKTLLWVLRGAITQDQQNTIDKLTNLDFTVTIVNDTDSEDVNNYSVTYVHPTVNSGTTFANIANLATTTKGIVTSENALYDEIMGTTGAAANPATPFVNIINNTHPITQGLPLGNLDIGDGSYIVNNILTGTQLGEHPNGMVSMVAWEIGEAMDAGIAPGRRVAVPHTSYNGGLNAAGEDLLVSAILWAWALDTDKDGFYDHLDIDSDNDGIPDNVEAQPSIGYVSHTGTINAAGLDTAYPTGIATLEDTDGDGILDYLDADSDNDGILDIAENGDVNTLTTNDTDNDGLDNNFDSNNISYDANDEVTTGNPADLTNSFGDADGDLLSGGDLDYRDLYNINPPALATIDFDGVDDYLSGNTILNGLNEVTIMAWVKIDPTNAGVSNITIAGEDISCRIYVQNGNKFIFGTRTTAGFTSATNGTNVNYDEWHHITGVFNGVTGTQTIYVDGKPSTSSSNTNQIGQTILCTSSWNGNFEIGRLSRNTSNQQYFNGEIDEVRVFGKALTADQIQQMVYQEIKYNSGNLQGTVIPKDIIDTSTNAKVSWGNLLGYYPMTDINNGRTSDFSAKGNNLKLNNITTFQDQTAPMPYESVSDGDWTTEGTWLHGDVWDIEDTASNKAWSIVHIKDLVEASHSIENLGLVIDLGKKLTIKEKSPSEKSWFVKNNWYLELNGTLDLLNDSQLIQTSNSDLVTSSTGKILRRQEGTASPYWYNYWSSPVGATAATSIIDNNTISNNPNNSDFSLQMLKDGSGLDCLFTSGYTGSGSISTYWLYTYKNAKTYWDWANIGVTTLLEPGVGYTQKGTGTSASEQQYIFEGKPNNGTILIDVDDVGGIGSVAEISKTEYLLGNPYASAIDVHKFIDDNQGVISGSLQLWQQWGGTSHNLNEYHGGYAQVNKTGSIRARQFVGFSGDTEGGLVGTIKPSKYLSVGQGFIIEIEDDGSPAFDGTVEFNNSQRVFIKESDANGTDNSGSVFSRSSEGKSSEGKSSEDDTSVRTEEENPMQKIRLELNAVQGTETKRELLLGFSDATTDGYDYGYDAKNTEISNNDLNLDLEGQNMNIQAYASISDDKVVPLNFKSSGDNVFEISITELEHIEEDQAIYLRDNLTGTYFDLRQSAAYSFSSAQGVFNDRFEIVFQNESKTLSTEASTFTENFMYYQNKTNTFFAKKLNSHVSKLSLINMRGQVVLELDNVSNERLANGIQFNNISTGAYIVTMRTDANEVLTKKIIVN